MARSRSSLGMALALFFGVILAAANAQSPAPAPTPTPVPTSDGTAIDQGIAYVLMLVALVLTYLIHPLDASSFSPYKFF